MLTPQQLQDLDVWEGPFFTATRRASRRVFQWLLHHWCGLRCHGTEHVLNLTQAIWAPTHASHLDFWAVLEGLPAHLVENTYIAAAEDYFYRSCLRKWTTRLFSYHNFPFQRQKTSLTSFHQLSNLLKAGLSLLLFPQATRSRDGRLTPFKPLTAMLALQTGVPIVPVLVQGTFEALPAGRLWPRRHPIDVCFDQPLDPTQFAGADPTGSSHQAVKNLNQQLNQRIETLWKGSKQA